MASSACLARARSTTRGAGRPCVCPHVVTTVTEYPVALGRLGRVVGGVAESVAKPFLWLLGQRFLMSY